MSTIITLILLVFTSISARAGNIADDVRSIDTGEYAGGDGSAQLLFLVLGVVVVLYICMQEHDKWKK